MFTKFFAISALMAALATPAFADLDWGIDQYDTYSPGYYNDTTSDLYNDNDDWFYDNYTFADTQAEEDAGVFDNTYAWEADNDLFADDEI